MFQVLNQQSLSHLAKKIDRSSRPFAGLWGAIKDTSLHSQPSFPFLSFQAFPFLSKMTSLSPMVATHAKDNYVIVLPVEGTPYIHGIHKHEDDKDNLKVLQSAVEGRICPYPREEFRIHPMFCENPRWNLARQMLTSKFTKVYVNEEGMYGYSPNMATVLNSADRVRFNGGCPHLFGHIALLVPKKVFDILCPDPSKMMMEEDSDEE